MKFRTTLAASAAALLAAVPAASAHISVSSTATAAGGYANLTLNVPHGCDGAPTTKLELKIPDGVTSFTPGRTAFWTPKLTNRKLDEPLTSAHGDKITEVPDTVVWTASTPLPEHQLDQITSSIKLPETTGQLNFPIVQSCAGGASTAWTQIAAEGEEEPESPAPFIKVTEATGDEHGAADADESEHADEATSDDAHDSEMSDLEDDVASARTLGYAGVGVGALGLLIGLVGISRRKR